jgi:cell division protein FtsN
MEQAALRTFHDTLSSTRSSVPTPASLDDRGGLAGQDDVAGTEGTGPDGPLVPLALERPRHQEDPVPEQVTDNESGSYSLQVASFKDQGEATLMVNRLKKAGHKSFIVSVQMPDRGGTWFRVRVGPFQSKQSAWQYKRTFEDKERLATFVVKRRSEG